MVARPEKPKKRQIPHPNWPLADELAVQTMYLVQGIAPAAIARSLSRSPQSISSLIFRRGWTAKVREKTQKAEELARTRTREHVERVVIAQSALAEAASVGALTRAAECAQDRSDSAAKDFRSWAGGARDLVNVMRQARGLVDPGKSNLSGDADTQGRAISLSFFIGSIGSNVPSNVSGGVPRATDSVHVVSSPAALTAGPQGPAIEIEAVPASTPSRALPVPSNARKPKGTAG